MNLFFFPSCQTAARAPLTIDNTARMKYVLISGGMYPYEVILHHLDWY
jgi:hypothetical protein